jgi:hypothetical protein
MLFYLVLFFFSCIVILVSFVFFFKKYINNKFEKYIINDLDKVNCIVYYVYDVLSKNIIDDKNLFAQQINVWYL